MKFEHIIFEKAERLATILLNRPKKLNALSVEMQKEIVRANMGFGNLFLLNTA